MAATLDQGLSGIFSLVVKKYSSFYYNTCFRVFSAYIACGITNGLPQLDIINTMFVSISC